MWPCFYRVSTKALIFDETKTKFLLMREDNGSRDFPGGGLEFGEDITESIIREVKEEAGLEVTWVASAPLYFVVSYNPEHDVRLGHPFYETKVKDFNFTPSEECQEIKFVTKEEAEKMNIRPNVVAFLKHCTL
ncbi:MAG: NUDIX hydrolase [candidate division SR1 bacterium]|nr:NUDIX hydrolase [candidate division SR1 bacterium]